MRFDAKQYEDEIEVIHVLDTFFVLSKMKIYEKEPDLILDAGKEYIDWLADNNFINVNWETDIFHGSNNSGYGYEYKRYKV